MAKGMQFSDKFRFKWVQAPGEVNYNKFVEGKHIVNHISNSKILNNKIRCMGILDELNLALQSEEICSEFFRSTDEFLPVTFRLDNFAGLIKFLQTSNEGLWLVKSSTGNKGRGIEMISDLAAFKMSLLTKPDKWGTPAFNPQEIAQIL